MTVFVTGGDGYLGWPTSLRIAARTDDRVVVVDDGSRREWVAEVGGRSATPVADLDTRLAAAREAHGLDNLSAVDADLTDRAAVDDLLQVHEPSAVVHTAAQPSGPYAQLNGERASFTQHNNTQATRNLLFGLHENGLADTHVVETTTTGQYGAPPFPVPEGAVTMRNGGAEGDLPFPVLTPSWYHASKGFDAANLRLAARQFDLPVSDVRTAIVYGAGTVETRADPRLATRLDFDYYFGTVAHRFCAQAVAGHPITVYGRGEQRKPFVALDDAVEGLARLALCDPGTRPESHVVYNQVTRPVSIVEAGETVARVAREQGYDTEVEHVENPRDEDETHRMEIENDRYADLIGGQSVTFEEGVRGIVDTLSDAEDRVVAHQDRFLPRVLKERLDR